MWRGDPDYIRVNYILPCYVARGIKAESAKRGMSPRDFVTMMFETYSNKNNLEYKTPEERKRFNQDRLNQPKELGELLSRVTVE